MKHLEVEFYCSGQAESLDEDSKAIEFSSKMVEALKSKVRDHNLKNDKNITLDTLKATFTNALTETLDSSLALAKVVDSGDHFEPSMEEIKEAEREIKKYGLENYNFRDTEDLYLQTDKEMRADAQRWLDSLD